MDSIASVCVLYLLTAGVSVCMCGASGPKQSLVSAPRRRATMPITSAARSVTHNVVPN